MFQQPSQGGDQVKIPELLGALVLVYVLEHRENITTTLGPKDAVAVNLHVLDGPKAGEDYENTLIFQKALIGALRGAIGGDPVLGRVGQGTAKPGQSAPYILQPFTAQDAAVATAWINARPKFQAAAAPGPTSAQGANSSTPAATPAASYAGTANPVAPVPPAAVPAAAAIPSPAAASPATGNGQVDYASLPPEVQELLRQSGAMPR